MKRISDVDLGQRLLGVSGFIRQDAVLCDVGTDHANLPIYLLSNGKIHSAVVTDINIGPIQNAMNKVSEYGLSDNVICIRTDGLAGTEIYPITDISICGMGGELVADILSKCEYIKDPHINLVLQPMTHHHDLRRYLYTGGFEIIDESLFFDTSRLYLVINARYTGENTDFTEAQLYVGKILDKKEKNELYRLYIEKTLLHFKNIMKSNDEQVSGSARCLYNEIKETI